MYYRIFGVFLHQYMYWYIGDIINLTKLSNLHNVSDGEKSMESKISSQNIKYVRNFHGFFFKVTIHTYLMFQ